MADIVSREIRSRMMAGIHGKNTKPELQVRKYLHGRGLRYRLHAKELPGKPDLVFPKYKVVVFVHGCFWHHHPKCRFAYIPKTNTAFWLEKLQGNRERDAKKIAELNKLGWKSFVVWECSLDEKSLKSLARAIRKKPAAVKGGSL
jgi:DNA mismatch endonuclease, patch repair protein